jgi:hypothetical protein
VSRSDRAVFRLPGVALIIPFLLFVCVTPLANAGADFWLALYIFPVAGLAYILLTQTSADAQAIRTKGLLGGRRIAWADLDGLEFHGTRWAIAVGTGGRRVRLPMVRPRDLPRLAQVSGGRLLLGRDAPAEPDGDPVDDQQVEVGQQNVEQVDVEQTDVEQTDVARAEMQRTQVGHAGVEQADAEQRG